jgi:pyridoxal phosphate enzyme (YggS family)
MNLTPWQTTRNECEPYHATLVAVSKTRTAEEIKSLYDAGQRIFGENRVQELIEKIPLLPHDIEWHLIGHLQTNKVKNIVGLVTTIHAVDSLKLLQEIEQQFARLQPEASVNVLLQIRIAEEETKFGLTRLQLTELLDAYFQGEFKHIRIVGVMGMATQTDDENKIREEFRALQSVFLYVRNGYFINQPSFKEISMGMSNDYRLALEEGSTMVRIGSLLFTS